VLPAVVAVAAVLPAALLTTSVPVAAVAAVAEAVPAVALIGLDLVIGIRTPKAAKAEAAMGM
jgi:hypothetical protein